ncbi:hypothetical protein AAG747_17435 [Rapidithrix thailandica]|uniref:Lipocalin-like domain-containing protein n=1 Tax=Rapidithrix thailandica TaxID=413964 RepID=A0AAW9SD27_9BACT
MTFKHLKIYTFCCLCSLLWSGCSEDPDVTPATYSDVLTGGTQKSWTIEAAVFIFDVEDFGEINLQPDCFLTGTLTFVKQNRELIISDHFCGSSEPIVTVWSFDNTSGQFTLGGIDYEVREIQPTTFKFGFKLTPAFDISNSDIPIYEPGFIMYTFKALAN